MAEVPHLQDDRTWYDMGYGEGYEAAAKIAREQYDNVSRWIDRVVELQEKVNMLEGFINEVISLRDAMDYPNGEQILNEVRASVEKRTK